MRAIYVIRPDRRGGFALSGPDLPWPLWIDDEMFAVRMAYHYLRRRGGKVIVVDSTGTYAIAESVSAAGGAHWLDVPGGLALASARE